MAYSRYAQKPFVVRIGSPIKRKCNYQGKSYFLFSAPRNTLQSGQQLEQDEALTSQNGAYRLVLQVDGNLVLYVSDNTVPVNALWTTGTFRQGPHRFEIQPDGNLVIYDGDNQASWASNTRRQVELNQRCCIYQLGFLFFC